MLFGGYLLTLPWATLDGSRTPFIDALFVAVSCVSVTGLTTVDTFHHWSIFGTDYNDFADSNRRFGDDDLLQRLSL